MLLKFKTKRDINGNTKTIIIDTDNKTFKTDYNPFNSADYIEITAKARKALAEKAIDEGYLFII